MTESQGLRVGGNGVRPEVGHGDPLLPLSTDGSEGAAKRRRLEPEEDLEGEDEVPEADLAEFVDRMECLGVTREMPEWANYGREHARVRRQGLAEMEEDERRRRDARAAARAGGREERGIDPVVGEGGNEPEETFMDNGGRPAAEEAEIAGEEDEDESRPVRTRIASYAPTLRERREHNVTHYPFRSWCPCCVAGRAAAAPHFRGGDKEIPVGGEFHFDYCFLRKRPASEPATTLVGVDRTTQGIVAHVVPKKGTQFEWVAAQLEKDVRKFGYHGRVVLKSDGENAIKDLMKEVALKRCDMPTVLEHSKAYDSKSNGRAENAVRRVESQVRTMLIALQEALGIEVEVDHPCFEWLVEHAADILTKYPVGKDGRTPYERVKKKKYGGEMFEFGSVVLVKLQGNCRVVSCAKGGSGRFGWENDGAQMNTW